MLYNKNFEVWNRGNTVEDMFRARCIERPGALIQGINRMQPAMMTSPDVHDYNYDVWKWRNRLI